MVMTKSVEITLSSFRIIKSFQKDLNKKEQSKVKRKKRYISFPKSLDIYIRLKNG